MTARPFTFQTLGQNQTPAIARGSEPGEPSNRRQPVAIGELSGPIGFVAPRRRCADKPGGGGIWPEADGHCGGSAAVVDDVVDRVLGADGVGFCG